MERDFKDKRVLVTAGADGIGAVIAESFYRAGASVHICARTAEKLRTARRGAAGADIHAGGRLPL